MEGRQQRVACCWLPAATWKPSSEPLLHQRFLKCDFPEISGRLPVNTLHADPMLDVQFGPYLPLALLAVNLIFCPSWQLLKNPSLHLFEFCRTTGGRGPTPHSLPRDLCFWSHGPCLPSCHLPSCFQRAPFRGDKGTHTEEERKSKKFPFLRKGGIFLLFDVQRLHCFSYLFSGKTPIWWLLVTSLSCFCPIIYPNSKSVNIR